MKLTKQTDHSFRVLMFLATRNNDQLATIAQVTQVFDLSKDSVMKIVQRLAKAGIIEAVRGKSGGMRLAKMPKEINLREVVELTEPSLSPVNCEQPMCKIRSGCQLAGILFDATEVFLQHIGQYTLADVLKPEGETVYIIRNLMTSG